MKRFLIFALILLAAQLVAAQDITGDWQGTLTTGMGELRMVLHVMKAPDGSLRALMDSPDQAMVGINVDTITFDGGKLHFVLKPINGNYDGTLKGNGSINGNWSQGAQGAKLPLALAKTANPVKLQHDPAPPSDIDGTWEGALETPGGRLRILFHIKNTADGLTATMDSPDQKMQGWPATAVTRKGASLKITMAQVSGAFEGKLNKTLDTMSGDWNQHGSDLSLQLKKAKSESTEPAKQ